MLGWLREWGWPRGWRWPRWEGWRALGVWLGWGVLVGIVVLVGMGWPHPAQAGELPSLTPLLLRDRLEHPISVDGRSLVDLGGLDIDLRDLGPDALGTLFYTHLQTRLGKSRLGLRLDGAILHGDLDLTRLGLRVPFSGQALDALLTLPEQEQLQRDRRRSRQFSRLSRLLLLDDRARSSLQISVWRGPLSMAGTTVNGTVRLGSMFFLDRVRLSQSHITETLAAAASRFAQKLYLDQLRVDGATQFRNAIFLQGIRGDLAYWGGPLNWQGSLAEAGVNFYRATFAAPVQGERSQWNGSADFSQTIWQQSTSFARAQFGDALYLTEAQLNAPLSWRGSRFARPVNLRGATVQGSLDFTNATFAPGAYVNVAQLEFDPETAKLAGTPGQIGQLLVIPSLRGNETLLRSLIRNFRNLEQITDANQVSRTQAQLIAANLGQRLTGVDLNRATLAALVRIGIPGDAAEAVIQARQIHPLAAVLDLLSLDGMDLATYLRVRDRVTLQAPTRLLDWFATALHWVGLSALLLLSANGTNASLVLGIGTVAIAWFSGIFWLVDRLRRFRSPPVVPTRTETIWMAGSMAIALTLGIAVIAQSSDRPLLSLATLFGLIGPVPIALITQLYRQGRYHNHMQSSYFVENGELRQLQLLIARLPIIPRFFFYRDRYMPLLWDRRWNWLNYYGLSLNNWLKFGFNDVRLRDECVPGIVSALVWYQWSLGLVYVALFLWTLSRTIPGLNLLIYFS